MDKKPSSLDGRVHCVPENLDDLPCKNCLLRFGGGYLCSPHAVHWNGGTPAEWVVTDRETTCLAFRSAHFETIPFSEAQEAFEWFALLANGPMTFDVAQGIVEDAGTDLAAVVYFYRKFKRGELLAK